MNFKLTSKKNPNKFLDINENKCGEKNESIQKKKTKRES